jgi:uncharacterized membrane protein YcgQ (UPF0703/DUF1980 family)
MNKRKEYTLFIIICILAFAFGITGCGKQQSAALNNKMKPKESVSIEPTTEASSPEISESAAQAEDDPEYQAFMDSITQAASQDSTQDGTQSEETPSSETKDFGTPDASGRVGYPCDIETDKKNFDGNVDIVVGDNLYTTQINDWYTNFDQYKGKTVEIEGYYIDDYAPYTFVGRFGPTCPYCNGGYVSFEFYTQEDLSELKSVEDWIKVKGILRQGEDTNGIFYYIEVLSLEKMDKVGKDTVTN